MIRLAQLKDLDAIMTIVDEIVSHLRSMGIPQWQNNYPNEEILTNDIMHQTLYVACDGIDIVGFFNVCFEKDPSYDVIYQGKWLTKDLLYAVVHRLAVCKRYHHLGVAQKMLEFVEEYAAVHKIASIRIDTHVANIAMNRLLEKLGYALCGIIYLVGYSDADKERNAYEKVLN